MTLIADTLRESGDMEHWPLRPCSSGSASPVHVGCKSASLRQSASTAACCQSRCDWQSRANAKRRQHPGHSTNPSPHKRCHPQKR